MKNIRKIIYTVSLFLLAGGFAGCDDLLDISDSSRVINGKDCPKNQHDVESLLMGCYNGLREPLNTEWMLTELRSDNSYQYSAASTNTTNLELNDLDMFRPMTTNTQIYKYWSAVYQNIKNINLTLSYLNLVEDELLRRQYEGECRFLRAYHYYNLVQLFGPVPLVTEYVTTDQAKKINRSPVEDVYRQIIIDLEFAGNISEENVLPLGYGTEEAGRITCGAAKTLLAKIYLLKKDYNQAKSLLLDIVNSKNAGSPVYGLLPDYAEVFSITNEMNKEIIFAIRYKADASGNGSPFANAFSPVNSGSYYIIGDGSSYNFPSADICNYAFESNDTRKDVTFIIDLVRDKSGSVRFVTKYYSKVKMKDCAENDWLVLRYSDVLLMLSEIYNEMEGPTNNAVSLLLQIRHRAGLDLDKTTLTFKSQEEFREAIAKERRAEFAFENQRFYDLVRTNQLIAVINQQMIGVNSDKPTERGWYSNYEDGFGAPTFRSLPPDKILLPIPQKEIDTSTEFVLTQNIGY